MLFISLPIPDSVSFQNHFAQILSLIGHFKTQKKLLTNGLQTKSPTNEIKRLMINGISLMILSILAIIKYEYPYGLWGCMIFIESAVSFSYAQKLLKK